MKQNTLLQEKLQKQEEMLAYISHYIQSREALQIEIEDCMGPGQVVGTLGTYSHLYPLYPVPPPCPPSFSPAGQDTLLQEELQTQEEMSVFLVREVKK